MPSFRDFFLYQGAKSVSIQFFHWTLAVENLRVMHFMLLQFSLFLAQNLKLT